MLLQKRIPLWYILSKIKTELIAVAVIGLLVHYCTQVFAEKIPPMPISIPAFLGTAISVILSFKLNQSYDRWWEARKIWGSIVNDSRNLVVQLQTFLQPDFAPIIKTIAFRQIAWCFALGRSLRGFDATTNLEEYLSNAELETVRMHQNKPLAILQLNAQDLSQLRSREMIDIFSLVQLNTTLVNLTNSMGMAERIKSTIFPATYRLFLHGFIYLFVITLSIALGDISTYFEIPLLIVISSAFFLLERTGTHLQDPFSNKPTDTAMTAIAKTIEVNLKQLLDPSAKLTIDQPNSFYLM
ncbi:MAG: bestrophin family ion channel [Chryseolinea sp.]